MNRTSSELSPQGILGVVQTPFTESGAIDWESHERLVLDALEAGADGFLVPAVASENAYLAFEEKIELATHVQRIAEGRAPIVWGAGTFDPQEILRVADHAAKHDALALLVAVSPELYREQDRIVPYFQDLSEKTTVPLMIQDWDPGGQGMRIEVILELFEKIETFKYLKIETIPAGPKYTAVLDATQGRLHVSGGWAVSQMIEALDRGVHAMIPESSMIRIYHRIDRLYSSGKREEAGNLFNRLIPVLAFTNQQLDVSIRFFKRLLCRKGIFNTEICRVQTPPFDSYGLRIADELIERVLELEGEVEEPLPPIPK
jgi:4-hydroxy-tetrahydrodipicolinate synthase